MQVILTQLGKKTRFNLQQQVMLKSKMFKKFSSNNKTYLFASFYLSFVVISFMGKTELDSLIQAVLNNWDSLFVRCWL